MRRSGASRKSRAWRVGGVSRPRGRSDRRRRARAASPSPCTRAAGERGGDLLVEAVVEDAAAARSLEACFSTRASNVRRVSSVMAHIAPRAASRPARGRAGGAVLRARPGRGWWRGGARVDRAGEHAPALERGWRASAAAVVVFRRPPSRTRRARGAPPARRPATGAAVGGAGPHAASRRRARRSMEEGPMSSSNR